MQKPTFLRGKKIFFGQRDLRCEYNNICPKEF